MCLQAEIRSRFCDALNKCCTLQVYMYVGRGCMACICTGMCASLENVKMTAGHSEACFYLLDDMIVGGLMKTGRGRHVKM